MSGIKEICFCGCPVFLIIYGIFDFIASLLGWSYYTSNPIGYSVYSQSFIYESVPYGGAWLIVIPIGIIWLLLVYNKLD